MKKILSLIVVLACILCGCSNLTNDISKATFDIEYHRGGRNNRPENTLYSYLYAIEDGATTIECDMQLTKEGIIVMSHDPFLSSDFTRDKNGTYIPDDTVLDIRNMTLEEIKSYDVAVMNPNSDYYASHGVTQIVPEHAEIPTIDELFTLVKQFGNGIQVNIETKIYYDIESDPRASIIEDPAKFVSLFYDKVIEYDMKDQIILQSFDWQALVEMEKLDPEIRTSALWSEQPSWGRADQYLHPYEEGASPFLAGLDIDDFKGDAVKAANSLGFDIVSPYCGEVTIDMVNEAHEYGMKIIPWNANNDSQMKAMYDMGVDGIITDNGPLLRKILLERGETLPKQKQYKKSPYHL